MKRTHTKDDYFRCLAGAGNDTKKQCACMQRYLKQGYGLMAGSTSVMAQAQIPQPKQAKSLVEKGMPSSIVMPGSHSVMNKAVQTLAPTAIPRGSTRPTIKTTQVGYGQQPILRGKHHKGGIVGDSPLHLAPYQSEKALKRVPSKK